MRLPVDGLDPQPGGAVLRPRLALDQMHQAELAPRDEVAQRLAMLRRRRAQEALRDLAGVELRDQFRGHPHFEYTARFCARHDQNAFDPAYDTMPLEAFVPMVQRVMARPKNTIYMRQGQAAAE